MNTSMVTATNTMSQLQKQMDIISNNLANLDTTGYKSRQATFTDLIVQQLNNQPDASKEVGRYTPNGVRVGSGAKLNQAQINMAQGSFQQTGRSLDTAFQKEGQYYKVLVQNNGTSSVDYTRNGALELSPVAPNETMLVNSDGYPILDDQNNPIIMTGDAKTFDITQNGVMNVTMTDGTTQSFNLGVVQINKPQFLEQKGGSLLGMPANVPAPSGVLTVLPRNQISIGQGMLEQSNVDMSKQMTDLLNTERMYQFQSRAITMSDQMMGLINSIR
jgi:flagellar basal-body rod protein FlgG